MATGAPLKPFPGNLPLTEISQRLREYLHSNDLTVRMLLNLVLTATGDLIGKDDVRNRMPADSSAATVSDLRDDFNALLAILRAL